MISASHNPYYDNGIKVLNGEGQKLEPEVEELIEKTNSTSNIVSKRKLKLPTSVTEKKKDVNSNNIIPIESLKEKSLSSKKTKRTLHLNLGIEPEEIKEEVKSESSIEDENSITMIIPKISTKKDEKEKWGNLSLRAVCPKSHKP